MEFEYKITIFTPTYNRAYILENLYRSIQRQTYRDFEWLILDDGSSDETEELVFSWMKDPNDFPIRYEKQPNGGKCRAINRGLDLVRGELFFIMDSDDILTDNALERIVYWESTIAGKKGFCGVVGNRGTSATETPNTPLGSEYRDGNVFERYPEYTDHVVDGERAGVWYTEIHRQYKYPEFEGENFLTPCITWNRMAHDGYQVRFFEDIIWICKYLEDGLTMQGNQRFLKNPAGHGLSLKEKADFLHYSKKQYRRMYYTFYCDHCDRLSNAQIAQYIGAPISFINRAEKIHRISKKLKGK